MARLGLVVSCIVAAGCYSPRLEPCKITCTEGCPPGWACAGDGYCHESVNEPACEEDPGPTIDGGRPRADAGSKADASLDTDAACGVDLLDNGTFDESTGTGAGKNVPAWVAGANVTIGDAVRTATEMGVEGTQAGDYAARLGGIGFDRRLCQDVTVPAGTEGLRVSGYLWMTTAETDNGTYDHAYFRIRTTMEPGSVLETILDLDNNVTHEGWTFFSADAAAPYTSQTIRFCFQAFNDAQNETIVRVDSLRLEALDCE
jgi:hypothetical protein